MKKFVNIDALRQSELEKEQQNEINGGIAKQIIPIEPPAAGVAPQPPTVGIAPPPPTAGVVPFPDDTER